MIFSDIKRQTMFCTSAFDIGKNGIIIGQKRDYNRAKS